MTLTTAETSAWRSLVFLWRRGLPAIDRTFRHHGITYLDYAVLDLLAERPDGLMSAGELSDSAQVSSSRLSHRLRILEQRGHVERRSATSDARVVEVALTAAGAAAKRSAEPEHLADVRGLFEPLNAEEIAALARTLGKIAAFFGSTPATPTRSETRSGLPDPPRSRGTPSQRPPEMQTANSVRLGPTFDPFLD